MSDLFDIAIKERDRNIQKKELDESLKFINEFHIYIALLIHETSKGNINKFYLNGDSSFSSCIYACLVTLNIKFTVTNFVTYNYVGTDHRADYFSCSGDYIENLFTIYTSEKENYSDNKLKHAAKVLQSFGLNANIFETNVKETIRKNSLLANKTISSFNNFKIESSKIELKTPNTFPSSKILKYEIIEDNKKNAILKKEIVKKSEPKREVIEVSLNDISIFKSRINTEPKEAPIEPIEVSRGGWVFIAAVLIICLFANFA
tara:strand:- start:52 stop:834 length:783 start_codon:yes stop_codon:yes gene_type:complete